MMNTLLILLAISLLQIPTIVQAYDDVDYEEISYSDLINQLNKKNKQIIHASEGPFDKLKIHAGVGYVNSFSRYIIENKAEHRYQNGIQVALGVDLFSDRWRGEVAYRNYGVSTNGTEELLTRELDLKFSYHELIKHPFEIRFQGGLANRFVQINDPNRNIYLSETSPAIMGSAGIGIRLNKIMSLGLDISGHSAVLGRSIDQNSYDLVMEMKASL